MSSLADLVRAALDLVFPLYCLGCRREGEALCPECAKALPRLEQPFCTKCAQPGVSGLCYWCRVKPPAFNSLRAPFMFEGLVREGIHRLKYRGHRVMAEPFAVLLADFCLKTPKEIDVVTPVPLHPRRLGRRGYNQSSLLARALAKEAGIEFRDGVLSRVRDTEPQVEAQSGEERRRNVSGVFAATGEFRSLRVLLVDDVATTGSTLSECSAALKAAGAAEVRAVALAREG